MYSELYWKLVRPRVTVELWFAWVVCKTWKAAEWAVVLAEKFLNSGDAWVVSDTVVRLNWSKSEARSFKGPRKLALSTERLDHAAEVISQKSKAAFNVTAVTLCVCGVQSRVSSWGKQPSDSENRCLSVITCRSNKACSARTCVDGDRKPAGIAAGH